MLNGLQMSVQCSCLKKDFQFVLLCSIGAGQLDLILYPRHVNTSLRMLVELIFWQPVTVQWLTL